MKPNRFIRLFLLLFASSAGMYFFSCQRDAEQPTTKPFSNSQVTFRACTNPSYCTCTVTTNADATLDLCGDIPDATTNCTGCNSTDKGAFGAEFVENEPKEFCVAIDGNLCIKNVGSNSVQVTVRFGTSTPIVITIGVNETQCFHNDGCDSTESHCQ